MTNVEALKEVYVALGGNVIEHHGFVVYTTSVSAG